jgi:hypothetical protein
MTVMAARWFGRSWSGGTSVRVRGHAPSKKRPTLRTSASCVFVRFQNQTRNRRASVGAPSSPSVGRALSTLRAPRCASLAERSLTTFALEITIEKLLERLAALARLANRAPASVGGSLWAKTSENYGLAT